MIRQSVRQGWMVGAVALGLLISTTAAFAQARGSLRGTVVDEAGNPVPACEVTLQFVGGFNDTATLKTNDKGEYVRAGLRTGQWKIVATNGELTGSQFATVVIAAMTRAEPVVIKAASGTAGDSTGMTAEEVEAYNKKMAAMQEEYEAAVAAIATDPDSAIATFEKVAAEVPDCAICYSKIGDAQMKKNDLAAAEMAYKKAIELDEKLPDPYSALAVLFNQQKKFDEAAEWSQKANDLLGASETGGDPATIFNQGIIYWNAGGKSAEAKAQFEKAIALDPTMADAYYWLGMANVNLGRLADAVKPFEEYLKLAPEGQYAELAKGILKQIK